MELMEKQGFKQTEVGLIPEDWSIRNLREVGDAKMCKRIFSYQTSERGDIPFYKIGTFGKEPDAFISSEIYNDFKKKFSYPKKGSILISAAGTVGRTVVFNGEDSYFQDSNIVWIDNDEKILTNEYLKHAFPKIRFRTEGGTIQRLYNNILLSGFFTLPPTLSEQKSIAAALSDVDELITNLDKLITKKKALKQGAMQQLLTPPHKGGKRLEGFTGEWMEIKLGEIADFYKGKGLPKSDIVEGGRYKCIHYGELFTKYNQIITNVKSRTNQNSNVLLSKKNDVLMPTSDVTPNGLATASVIFENDIILGGDVLVIRPHKNLYGGFLSYQVSINKQQIMSLITGTTVFHLYGSDMAKFSFYFPDFEEQKAIVDIINDMDIEIEKLETKKTKYQSVKQGMMQELLTGKTRLV